MIIPSFSMTLMSLCDQKCLVFAHHSESSVHSLQNVLGGCFCRGPRKVPPSASLRSCGSLSNKTWTHSSSPRPLVMEDVDEGMFSVESAVRQLKPDYILQHVLEAEERQWSKVHLGLDHNDDSASTPTSSSPHTSSGSFEQQDPGVVLLRHGTSVRKIHNYFSQLELRKCCLHLAGRKSTFQSMRVVHASNNSVDDGSAKRSAAPPTFVTHLEDKELRAFKHAFLCAAYPVLAAPDPPSPFSPSPVNPQSDPGSPHHRTADVQKSSTGTATPYSLHDSGLEESEDLAFIPSESICAHLQRAFHLTDEKFRDYRRLINKTYVRKSAQKLLAEELAGQLAVLENNMHPFYKPQDFLPPNGYEEWRKAEHSHITELLSKFWQHSLPFPRNAQDLMHELHSVHDDFRILLTKLLAYEREFHRQAEEAGGMLVSPLSTASVRLLKEFGLRYGVGEQFRRILYLEQISLDFSPSLWYLRHVLCMLNNITDLLPSNRRLLAMVMKEYDILHGSLLRLTTQVSKALEQMKSIFPNNKPAGGIELLIAVLQKVRDLRLYLQGSTVQQPPPLVSVLADIVQGTFFQTYEKYKTVIRTELKNNRDVHVCPRMLNALIMEMRNEVLDYKNNFETVFRQYFDIAVMAAKAFYGLLMKDVESLCQQEKLRDNAIDLRMLALVYRLDQLDNAWAVYIRPQEQMWRQSFQTHVEKWGQALLLHVQDLVLDTIAGDAFVTQQVQLPSDVSPPLTSTSSSPCTTRSFSLAPSVNSAFSSFPSTQGSLSSQQWTGSLGKVSVITNTPTPTATPTPGFQRQQSSDSEHTGDFLSFADKRRHCASLPVFPRQTAIVRVVSDARLTDQGQGQGLKSASGVEDLRGDGDASNAVRGMRYRMDDKDKVQLISTTGLEQTSGEEDVSCEVQGYLLDAGTDSDESLPVTLDFGGQNEGELSDSADETFTFPPVQDVTDINISDSNMSYTDAPILKPSRWSKKMKTGKKPALLQINLNQETKRSGFLRSVSQEKEAEERARGLNAAAKSAREKEGERVWRLGKARQGGRQSCPQPHARSHSKASVGSAAVDDGERHAFQPLPQRLQPAQVSAFRKISTASVGTESEHQFLQSIQSTVSFLTPNSSLEVVIPVSGSTVDLLVLLQRTLGFGRTLCQTIFSFRYRERGGGGGGEDGGGDSDVAALRASLELFQASAHLNIVQILCHGVGVYADNMMCLDLCAVPKEIAKRVIGSSLVEHVMSQRKAGRIWGCRHQLEGHLTCYAFHNRKASYLSDRYEPITQKMCVRINNLMACQKFLDWCQTQTQAPRQPSGSSDNTASGNNLSTSESSGHTHPKTAGESDNSGSCPSGDSEETMALKQQHVDQMRTHLMAVWTALCRLLAFRINLFLRDGLTLLLSLKPADVSIATCLLPLTTFLRSHLDALSSWLYSHSFRRVIEFLWIYIVQNIEVEASKLQKNKDSKLSPHILLQTVMHLMRFMNNCEKGITRELLLSQADDVVTKLQLFTLSTLHLIALYQRLVEVYTEGDLMTLEERRTSPIPVRALHQLHRDLQRRRKCFSGAQLASWIQRNADLFLSSDELSLCRGHADISTQGALSIAQQLLDMQLIMDVEAESALHSCSNSIASMQEYPEVSILDHYEGHGHSGRQSGYQDDDLTPTPTPQQQQQTHSAETTIEVHGAQPSSSEEESSTPQQSDTRTLTADSTTPPTVARPLTAHTEAGPGAASQNKGTQNSQNMSAEKNGAQSVCIIKDGAQNVSAAKDNAQNLSAEKDNVQRTSSNNVFVKRDSDQNMSATEDTNRSMSSEKDNAGLAGSQDSAQNLFTGEDSAQNLSSLSEGAQNVSAEKDITQILSEEVKNAQDMTGEKESAQTLSTAKDSNTNSSTETEIAQNVSAQADSREETVTEKDCAATFSTEKESHQDAKERSNDQSNITEKITKENMAAQTLEPASSSLSSKVTEGAPEGQQSTTTHPALTVSGKHGESCERAPVLVASAGQGVRHPFPETVAVRQKDTGDPVDTDTSPVATLQAQRKNHPFPETVAVRQKDTGDPVDTDASPVATLQAQRKNHPFPETVAVRQKDTGDPVDTEASPVATLQAQRKNHPFPETVAVRQKDTGDPVDTDASPVATLQAQRKVGGSDFEDSGVVEVQGGRLSDDQEVGLLSKISAVSEPAAPSSNVVRATGTALPAADASQATTTIKSNISETTFIKTNTYQGATAFVQPETTPHGLTRSKTTPAFTSAQPVPFSRNASAKMLPSYSIGSNLPRYTPASVYDLDMNSICPTPMSFTSLTPFQGLNPMFENSAAKFYFLPANPMSVPLSNHPQHHQHSASLSPLDRSLLHLKNSEETGSLAEKCFTLKVTPVSILMVLLGRKKTDELARTFLQQLPPGLLEQVAAGVESRSSECAVL